MTTLTAGKRLLVAPTLLTLALGLTACGGSDDAGTQPSSTGSSKPTATGSSSSGTGDGGGKGGGHTISPPLKQPPAVDGSPGAVADIDWDASSCKTAAGTETTSGTVTNPTKKPADYVIQINWTNAGNDVLGNGFAVVKQLGPGKKASWKVTGKIISGATQCVPHVERGTLSK